MFIVWSKILLSCMCVFCRYYCPKSDYFPGEIRVAFPVQSQLCQPRYPAIISPERWCYLRRLQGHPFLCRWVFNARTTVTGGTSIVLLLTRRNRHRVISPAVKEVRGGGRGGGGGGCTARTEIRTRNRPNPTPVRNYSATPPL